MFYVTRWMNWIFDRAKDGYGTFETTVRGVLVIIRDFLLWVIWEGWVWVVGKC